MKTIMILGAGILQLPAIKKALKMGLRVVAVDMDANAVGMKIDGVIPEVISTIDTPAIVDAARRLRVDGVMTLASDMPMRSVAAVAKALNLSGISEETALKATSKAEMRKALSENGVPIPKFFVVSSKEEYLRAVSEFDSEFMVKPADNSGSRGIFKVSDLSDKTLIDKAYEYSKGFSRGGELVIEEYMSGPEVSVETLTVDGVCNVIQITDKITTGAPHFVEMGHTQPSRLEPQVLKEIEKLAKDANKAVGIQSGPAHTEIIVTESGAKIVELGARLGGDCITTHLTPLSTGVDMVESTIKIALGEEPDITPKYKRGSAIRYFEQKSGVIEKISGIEDAEKHKGVIEVNIVHGVGERITEIESSTSRMGFVIAEGESADKASENCESALSLISVEIGE